MYDLVDRPVCDLNPGAKLLVWAMRAWLLASRRQQCPAHVVAPAFARWHIADGLQPFRRTMVILDNFALERIEFNPLTCRSVSEHEAVLISLVRLLCAGERVAARDVVSRLVDADHAGDCLAALSGLALALDRASLLPGAPCAATSQRRDREA